MQGGKLLRVLLLASVMLPGACVLGHLKAWRFVDCAACLLLAGWNGDHLWPGRMVLVLQLCQHLLMAGMEQAQGKER